MNDHLELRPVKVKDGLGHHGEPEEEEEEVGNARDDDKSQSQYHTYRSYMFLYVVFL